MSPVFTPRYETDLNLSFLTTKRVLSYYGSPLSEDYLSQGRTPRLPEAERLSAILNKRYAVLIVS